MTDAGDEEGIVGTELAERESERLHIGAVAGLDDEGGFEGQVDHDAQPPDGIVELAVIRAGSEAVADEQKVARAGELGAADEDAGVVADFDPQVTHQELGVAAFGQPYIPALIEIGFGAQPPHRVRNRKGQLAFKTDLKQLDFTHHTLPQTVSRETMIARVFDTGSGRVLELFGS